MTEDQTSFAEVSSPQPQKSPSIVWDFSAIGGGLLLGWYYEWEAKDLVWSLWLSSLLVGYAVLAVKLIFGALTQTIRAITGVQALIFFSIHFCLIHLLYAFFLNGLFPITDPGQSLGPEAFKSILMSHWLFIVAVGVSERGLFEKSETEVYGPLHVLIANAGAGVFTPYHRLFRIHALILIFALLHLGNLESYPVYAGVYLIIYLPWKRFINYLEEPARDAVVRAPEQIKTAVRSLQTGRSGRDRNGQAAPDSSPRVDNDSPRP